jgi:SAM-dependent methyltransferase
MTGYEILRQISGPFLPVLHSRVRRLTRAHLAGRGASGVPEVLDVGGRFSPYTVGLPARVTVVDLARRTEIQRRLHLGLDHRLAQRLAARRSNVVDVVIEDFTATRIADESFDIVLAIETLEHVEDDALFVAQAARVLRPGGSLLVTTPNGDYIRNRGEDFNPDHLRHYTRGQLATLLTRSFPSASVWYDVRTGRNRYRGLRPIDLHRPGRALSTLIGNLLSHVESRGLDRQPLRTAHLFAVARKPTSGRAAYG